MFTNIPEMSYFRRYSLLLFIIFIVGCKEDDPIQTKSPLSVQTLYDTTNFVSSTKQQYVWRKSLVDLATSLKKGRTKGATVSETELKSLLSANGFEALISSYYKEQANVYIQTLSQASGGEYNPLKSPSENKQGGVFGEKSLYLFDEHGLEPEQCIEKGLFGAALYNYAVTNYLTGTVTNEKLNQALILFGADPSFPNTNTAANTTKPDVHAALYAARRDDNSGTGFYRQIQKQFLTAQAAIKAGSAYNDELQAAVKGIRENWEKAIAATVINYLYASTTSLSKTNPTVDEIAGALHAYSECVGFIHGLKNIPTKIITDKEIDNILTLFLVNDPTNVRSYLFVQEPITYLPNFVSVQNSLKSIYKFTDTEMESFKKNWISEQKR